MTTARILLAWLLACVVGPAAAFTLRDDGGTEHRFERTPQRIVSLLPSLTESVCVLGGCTLLVGVDRYSNWPASIAKLPRVGGLEDAQVERIAGLKPDVVLASKSARVTERLESLGLRVVLVESQTHADVRRSLGLIARLLGTPELGERQWAGIEAEIQAAAARVPPSWRGTRVYFEVSSDPYAAGASSFIGETLARLGLANIVPPELGPFPRLNPEYVLRLQPDLVIAPQRELQAIPGRPGWQGLRALKAKPPHVCGFDTARYELLIRPGPRMGEAAGALADCLQHLTR
jgi:iron complex transport system substrate-binding protein